MTQLLQVLVIAKLLLSRTLLYGHAENDPLPRVLYVTPHSNIPCPEMPCLTLSQYTLDQDTYFGNDTKLCFLSGVHRLSNSIVIVISWEWQQKPLQLNLDLVLMALS